MHTKEVTRIKHYIFFLFLSLLIIGWRVPCTDENDNKTADATKAFQRSKNIGRGINFGNALESPIEGAWGLTIKEFYIQAIADLGFNSVRLPICWSAHTGSVAPYTIGPVFLTGR